jgi:hypothetical protein
MTRRLGRLRRAWAAIRRRIPGLGGSEPPDSPWSPFDPALVPAGPPRRDPPAGAVALEPPSDPDPLEYPTETDAVGRSTDDAGDDAR